MDFLEDIEMYESAMQNAYDFIINNRSVQDVIKEMRAGKVASTYHLPFDPQVSDGRDISTIDLVIEYMVSIEEYEKCAELAKIRECLKTPTE